MLHVGVRTWRQLEFVRLATIERSWISRRAGSSSPEGLKRPAQNVFDPSVSTVFPRPFPEIA